MSEQTPEPTVDPEDFHAELETPVYDRFEGGADRSGIETRDVSD